MAEPRTRAPGPPIRIGFGFPNRPAVAAASLGVGIVADLLMERPEVELERFYLPRGGRSPEAGESVPAGSIRLHPSGHALASADLLLLSVSYEGDAIGVPAVLEGGGMPARAVDRSEGHPLVVGGGAMMMINPEPVAAFFDVILVGEAEAFLHGFLDHWQALRTAPRVDRLTALASRPGVLVPLLRPHRVWSMLELPLRATETVVLRSDGVRATGHFSDRAPGDSPSRQAGNTTREAADSGGKTGESAGKTADSGGNEVDRLVETIAWHAPAGALRVRRMPPDAPGPDVLIELGRGCPRTCRFCAARRIYRPVRDCRAEALLEQARSELRPGDVVGLMSLSAGDYRGLGVLTRGLRALDVRLSLSSVPAVFDRREVLDDLLASGARTLTIAPETGSDRLRRLVGKPMTNDGILRAVRAMGEAGLERLNTYFLIGLPGETTDDREAILTLLAAMRTELAGRCRLSATVNAFVPKPRTVFQWAPMASLDELKPVARRLRAGAPRGVEVRVKSLREALVQALLARGDVTWGERLLRASRAQLTPTAMLRRDGLSADMLTGPVDEESRLPWSYLLRDEETVVLRDEWNKARSAEEA